MNAYVQCRCPKHGETTFLHADLEKDDFCLLPVERIAAETDSHSPEPASPESQEQK